MSQLTSPFFPRMGQEKLQLPIEKIAQLTRQFFLDRSLFPGSTRNQLTIAKALLKEVLYIVNQMLRATTEI